ncbi:hypothetical protein [Arthrobacter sp. Leaf141]|uniref:hypothetical protein n=1 Tax=Arthrobacter sp. Leaf141 TaxID=1736273 RepID=UPI0012F82E9E|nr:hypothetical protein [Arthrobacter sp. Leaf141]
MQGPFRDDMQAMFRWFAETPGYAADLEQVRSIAPGTWTFEQWLGTVGLAPAS